MVLQKFEEYQVELEGKKTEKMKMEFFGLWRKLFKAIYVRK